MDVRKSLQNLIIGSAAALFAVASVIDVARADDTEIYLTPPRTDGAEPLVMFSIDYRSNLTAPAKANVESYFIANGMAADVAELKAISGSLTYFDTLILSLKYVLGQVSGVKIGLMFNHANGAYTGYQGESPTPTNKRDSGGGVILFGFRSLSDATTLVDFKAKLLALKKLKPLSSSADHTYQGAELFFDFFRYLTGGKIFNSHNGWVDFEQGSTVDKATNMRCTHADATINPACWDASIENPSNPPSSNPATSPPAYISPLTDLDVCAKIYTINFLFKESQDDNDSNSAIALAKTAGGMGFNPGTSKAFDNVLGFLHDSDLADGSFGTGSPNVSGKQNVTSYFLVDPRFIGTKTNGYASKGGTQTALPLADDPAELVAALKNIFNEILSTSTTFVAASIPVNVFNRSQAVDNIYLALFQAELQPSWNGDLKKLRIKRAVNPDGSQTTVLVDSLNNFDLASDNTSAFGATDGRIRYDALTFWSDNAGALMQLGDANSDGQIDTPNANSTTPANPENVVTDRDGRFVNRGGAGQKIPGFYNGSAGPGLTNPGTGAPPAGGPRKMFYDSASNALTALNADAATAAALCPTYPCPSTTLGAGVIDSATALSLLKWIRGIDVDDVDVDGSITDTRPWLFGDPLHSRPTPINYGLSNGYTSTRRPAIFIAVSGNDGLMHFVENTTPGGAPTTGDAEAGTQSGKELWSFMPKAAMGVQKLLRTNTALPTNSSHPNYDSAFPTRPFSPHPYTLDGPPTVLVKDVNGNGTIDSPNDRVYLYFGMRRGGRNYYGLNITDPYNPTLMWTITGGSGNFAELGRSFSQPRTGRVRVVVAGVSVLKDVLVFAGGYSNNKDYKALGTDDTVGNAIYVVDALNGSLIWKATGNNGGQTASATNFVHASLVDSIPATPAVVDTDGDSESLTDRILVGDTGGNVWRADLVGDNTVNWTLTRLANLGRHYVNDKANDRRFLNTPDLVQDRDDIGPYDGVILGSGDREDPLDVGGVTDNWFYVIKDRNIGVGASTDSSLQHDTATLTDITDVCVPSGTTEAVPCTTGTRSSGWKLHLNQASGEKNLSAALTISGTIYFTTYLKAGTSEDDTCGPAEGSGLLYAVKLDNGAPAYNYDLDDGSVDNPGSAGDRTNALDSGGIPSQVVYLPPLPPCTGTGCPPPPEDEECPSGGDIVLPDGSVQRVCPLTPKPTFWRRRED